MSELKSYNGNTNKLFIKLADNGLISIRSKHNFILNGCCFFIGHWFGIDEETQMFRVCARCGRFEQYDIDIKKWMLRTKWQRPHGF